MDPIDRLRFRPTLSTLETRLVPATVAPAALVAVQAPTINEKVVAYLDAHMGQRIGGGECAHVPSEALRAAGAKFIRGADYPVAGDYVWGSLVTQISFKSGKLLDSAPAVACKPGDIIQYRNTVFSNGMWASHHTSIVAAVDSRGRPTAVYEQNFNGQRYLVKNPIDFGLLTAGYVRIYRGVARAAVAGRTEFTIVNNAGAARGGVMYVGSYNLGAFILGASNTAASYQTRYITATPGLLPRITVGVTTVTLVNGGAYELFLLAGRPSIRRIA